MTGQPRENVAIFNPLVLPLPNWHPDGPDGAVDGFVVPFVFPDNRPSGRKPNRDAKIRVFPNARGWTAALRNCQDHAETAEQARAFAAAWIRAAEVLENVGASAAKSFGDPTREPGEPAGDVEHQGASVSTVLTKPPRLPGEPKSDWLAESDDENPDRPDNPDGSCGGCGAPVDSVHEHHCPVWLARIRRSRQAEQ